MELESIIRSSATAYPLGLKGVLLNHGDREILRFLFRTPDRKNLRTLILYFFTGNFLSFLLLYFTFEANFAVLYKVWQLKAGAQISSL